MEHTVDLTFESDCAAVVSELRASLAKVYEQIGMDPGVPQEMARRFNLNKTLTWHLSRLMSAETAMLGMPHIPGTLAMEKVLRAVKGAGAGGDETERVRSAMRRYDIVIRRHVDDRTTLDLMLDGMATEPEHALEASRRLAFRGASGIRGVQVQTRVLNAFVIPNAENPDYLDVAAISGYIGVRRLRPRVRCMLLTVRSWRGDEDFGLRPRWEPIFEPTDGNPSNSILDHYGKRGHAGKGAELVATPEGMEIVLAPGEVGNLSMFDIARADILRGIGNRYADENNDDTGEVSVSLSVPSERLVFDLLYHKDLDFVGKAKPMVFDLVDNYGRGRREQSDPSLLPFVPPVIDLGEAPLMLSSPHVPDHGQLARKVCQRLGVPFEDMRGIRLDVDYPPLNSDIMLRFDLPRRP